MWKCRECGNGGDVECGSGIHNTCQMACDENKLVGCN